MVIFKDGVADEEFKIYSLKTKPEMHEFMLKKGFVKKEQSVIYKDQRIRKANEELGQMERIQPMYSAITYIYVAMGSTLLLFGMFFRNRKGRTSRK